ncbi:hypothetical protein K470DRAFT_6739 [Piedraia hortae CBS 480.64]|uniref:Uncharacterized protein n=1 Tax=Piedraia hortae CBS 480.64 TaxID=1314780 RepID=A0A6A7CBQ1_9PEZI|nr:hypothetical protein K470DRAFT_6739 [Piedraia hortae CBS 480.64]
MSPPVIPSNQRRYLIGDLLKFLKVEGMFSEACSAILSYCRYIGLAFLFHYKIRNEVAQGMRRASFTAEIRVGAKILFHLLLHSRHKHLKTIDLAMCLESLGKYYALEHEQKESEETVDEFASVTTMGDWTGRAVALSSIYKEMIWAWELMADDYPLRNALTSALCWILHRVEPGFGGWQDWATLADDLCYDMEFLPNTSKWDWVQLRYSIAVPDLAEE